MSTDGQEHESPRSAMDLSHDALVRPSGAQRRYLERGVDQAGGKLPLFDREGRAVPIKTVQACIAHGWAEPWTRNPIKPDWLVCRLTAAGYEALGRPVPAHAAAECMKIVKK